MSVHQQNIVGIYLAAGSGTRMGGDINKLALPLGGRSLGSLALQTALQSRLDHVLVVTRAGDTATWIDSALREAPFSEKWTWVPCADAWLGQAHSLRCGVQAAQERGATAAMVMLADQPFISEEIIDKLLAIFQTSTQERPLYVASSHQGLAQPPLLFSAELFPELLRLQGDTGARNILPQLAGQKVEFADALAFFDVDTPGAYQLACKLNRK